MNPHRITNFAARMATAGKLQLANDWKLFEKQVLLEAL